MTPQIADFERRLTGNARKVYFHAIQRSLTNNALECNTFASIASNALCTGYLILLDILGTPYAISALGAAMAENTVMGSDLCERIMRLRSSAMDHARIFQDAFVGTAHLLMAICADAPIHKHPLGALSYVRILRAYSNLTKDPSPVTSELISQARQCALSPPNDLSVGIKATMELLARNEALIDVAFTHAQNVGCIVNDTTTAIEAIRLFAEHIEHLRVTDPNNLLIETIDHLAR